jgi:hypothetical protein
LREYLFPYQQNFSHQLETSEDHAGLKSALLDRLHEQSVVTFGLIGVVQAKGL